MSQNESTFGDNFKAAAALVLGGYVAVKGIEWVEKNVTWEGVGRFADALANSQRVLNPDAFDAAAISEVKRLGGIESLASPAWQFLSSPYFTDAERTRIFNKLMPRCVKCGAQYLSKCRSQVCNPPQERKCGACGKQFLSKFGLIGYAIKCDDCRPKKAPSKKNPSKYRRRRRVPPPAAIRASETPPTKQLAQAPAVEESPAPAELQKPVEPKESKKRGGREEGSRNKKTDLILEMYDKRRAAGDADEQSRAHVTSRLAPESKRGIKNIRRSVDAAVEKYRNGGRSTLE